MSSRSSDDNMWSFLDPWFALLHGHIEVDNLWRADTEDALDFGRDPATDWRLHVDWRRYSFDSDRSPSARDAQVCQSREAMLLIGAFASVDYDAWISKLCTLSGFVVPPWMDLTAHKLEAKFNAGYSQFESLEDNLVPRLLAEDYCEAFERDYARLCDLASTKVVLPRLGVLLSVRAATFLQAVEAMLTIHLRNATAKTRDERPRFVVDSLHDDQIERVRHSATHS